jgi:hypothetical protein
MVKLDDIIKGFLVERGEETSHNYSRMLRLAIDGLNDLYIDVSGVSKVVNLSIDTNNWTANIPRDFISLNRMSVCVGERLYPLMEDNNICVTPEFNDCGDPADRANFPYPYNRVGYYYNSSFYQNTNWRVGEYIGRQYGAGGGQSTFGRFRMDTNNGWIQFQALRRFDSVIMEYLANPKMLNGEFMVHEYDVQALRAYLFWASVRSREGVSLGEKTNAERLYYAQKNIAIQRHNAPTLDKLYQTIYKHFQLAPKI